MNNQRITYKAPNARKEERFSVYPFTDINADIQIQSQKRIMCMNIKKNTLTYSKACASGAYFAHLQTAMGAKVIVLPDDLKSLVQALKSSKDKSIVIMG